MSQSPVANRRVLTVFTLAMINVAAIVSLKNLPFTAEYGLAAIFFYAISALIFFIPCSLVSAELATGWPQTGGVYVWVKEAFGPRWGYVAIWLQWVENFFWYPTILSFVAGAIAYVFHPELASNRLYTLTVILVVFWGATLVNFLGMKASGWISTIGVILGTLIPGALIISLGVGWVMMGGHAEIPITWRALIPDMSQTNNIVYLVGVLLALAGMEMSAVHAQEVKNPQRDYPRAIFLSAAIILVLSVLGSLAISLVVPAGEISLVAGVMQAFAAFFHAHHMEWLTPIIAALAALGAIGMASTWIVGPSKGLMATAQNGDLPPLFQKKNNNHMPVPLLLLQGAGVTALSLVFLFMPNVSSSFWILTALTAQLYLLMYVLMFIAAIRLRYSKPEVPRSYRVPGGGFGMWVVAGLGALSSGFAIVIGFFPPSQIQTGKLWFYEAFLGGGMLFLAGVPLILFHFRRAEWIPKEKRSEP